MATSRGKAGVHSGQAFSGSGDFDQIDEYPVVRAEVGIFHELDMPPADAITVAPRSQAFGQGLLDLARSDGFAEGRADVQVDVRLRSQAFGDQARPVDPGTVDRHFLRRTAAKFQAVLPDVEKRMS
jgi:hypothetical protein